jgi:hypothetical protein
MFRSATDYHQGVHLFLVKITELKCESSYVLMRQHNIQCIYVVSGVVRRADSKLNSVALVRERTIPTERPPPVGEVSANFCG